MLGLVTCLLLGVTGVVDQGAPGKKGPWPVRAVATNSDGGTTLTNVAVYPATCAGTSMHQATLVSTSAANVPQVPTPGRYYVNVCNSLQNAPSALVKCRADGVAPVLASGNAGDVLLYGDCVMYAGTTQIQCIAAESDYVLTYECRAAVSLGSNCACAQLSDWVAVRGRPDVAEDGRVGFCSTNGSFESADAGDFVACAINTPRVMAGAMLVEPSGSPTLRINYLNNASQFDNADWVKLGVTSAAPVVVADQAAGPTGSVSGDLVTFAATTAADLSVLIKSTGSGTVGRCPPSAAHASGQCYLLGATLDGGTKLGTLDMGLYSGAVWGSVACAYNGITWTRCKNEDKPTGANGDFYIGNGSAVTGIARPAQSVYMWGCGCEEGANASSPIDSTTPLSNGQQWTRMPDIITSSGGRRTAWVGDSLSANTVASTSSTQVYPRAPERYATQSGRVVDNWAMNGATLLTDIEGQWTTYGLRSGATRIIIWGGINDIVIGGVSGHALWTAFLTFVQARLAEGRTVVLINLTPFKGYVGYTAGLNTQRLDFNSDMAAYCAGLPTGVTCIDMAAALWDPADHDALLAANAAPDSLHLSQTGATLAGDTVVAGAP